MKACHIAKVEVRSLLVQTVTSRARPKHFQMSANSVTGAASMWRWRGEGWRDGGGGREEGREGGALQHIVKERDGFGLQIK